MASEQTAAVDGAIVGKVRRDPMAMLPFCGYNMGDYFGHWLAIGEKLTKPPVVFHVNWFRKGADGKFLWPGYGQNVRALMWMFERINQAGKAQETAIGYVPTPDALNLDGLDISPETMTELLRVDPADWQKEAEDLEPFFAQFGDHLPDAITQERAGLLARLSGAPVAP
jgi:phosphoenolpyruvate carboxykinase (GTP)